jgi:hypothetical protein
VKRGFSYFVRVNCALCGAVQDVHGDEKHNVPSLHRELPKTGWAWLSAYEAAICTAPSCTAALADWRQVVREHDDERRAVAREAFAPGYAALNAWTDAHPWPSPPWRKP